MNHNFFQWTSKLLPCSSYCKEFCSEHWGTCVFFNFGFLRVYVEKAMAPHSSTLAWKIPGTVEPGGLPFMGSHRVRHNWSDLAAAAAAAGYMTRSGIAGSYGGFIPSFLRNLPILSSIVAISIYIPTNGERAFLFLHTLSSIYCLQTFGWWPFSPVWGDVSL